MESAFASAEGNNILDIPFDRNGNWKKEHRSQPWPQQDELQNDQEFIHALQLCMKKMPAPWFSAIQLRSIWRKKKGKK
jgi:hypothetical protein